MDGWGNKVMKPIVYIVAPSAEFLESIAIAANESHFIPLPYETFDQFAEYYEELSAGCILLAAQKFDSVAKEQILRIFSRHFSAQVILVLSSWNLAEVVLAVQQGVSDVLSDRDPGKRIVLAISQAVERDKVCRRKLDFDLPWPIRDQLDDQESEILSRLINGQTTKQIVAELEISARTIHYRKQSIYAKIGVQDRNEAIEVCRRHRKADTAQFGWYASLPTKGVVSQWKKNA